MDSPLSFGLSPRSPGRANLRSGLSIFCTAHWPQKLAAVETRTWPHLSYLICAVFERPARICCLIWDSSPYLKLSLCLFSTSGVAITFLRFLVVMTRRVS
jgi:hypothetical protein